MLKNIPTHQHVASVILDHITAITSKAQIIMSPEAAQIVIEELELSMGNLETEAEVNFIKAVIALIKEEIEV